MNFTLPKDFVLVFYHNAKKGFFPSKKAAMFSQNRDRFSLLSRIDDKFRTSSNNFEFILYYPDLDEFCHWKQSENPLFVDNLDSITFEKVDCVWNELEIHPFKGLRKSDSFMSFLDSAASKSFFYSVGMYRNDSYNLGLAGPYWNYKNTILWEEYLYMKVEDPSLLKYLYSVCSPYYSREIYLQKLLTTIMI